MFRNKIFSVVVRKKQYYVKALYIDCASRLLTQYGLGFKDLKPAPGNCKKALTPFQIMLAVKKITK